MENIHVDYGYLGAVKVALCFEEGDARYHIWMDLETLRLGGWLFKNSKAKQGEPGYFHTRQLDKDSKPNRPKIVALLRAVNEGNLITKARVELEEKKKADEKARVLAEIIYFRKAFADTGHGAFAQSLPDPEIYRLGMAIVREWSKAGSAA